MRRALRCVTGTPLTLEEPGATGSHAFLLSEVRENDSFRERLHKFLKNAVFDLTIRNPPQVQIEPISRYLDGLLDGEMEFPLDLTEANYSMSLFAISAFL